jgi:hypothetical protein
VRTVIACSILMLLTGCATQLTSYTPTANQTVVYDQGIGAITWEADGVVLTMYPTFSYPRPTQLSEHRSWRRARNLSDPYR